jgi:alginate O-acetyltransferase complex protein AlgI
MKSERRVRWHSQMFASGLERILYGYAKVIVLANWFVSLWLLSFANKAASGSAVRVFLDSALYGFHLYFAIAGYSDIAIGLSMLLGHRICENFNRPFLARNIGEFWQSWHISLSMWCRQYIFMPVFSTWRNLATAVLASMIAIGIWHEFSPRYLLWGIYHGMGLLIWRSYQRFVHPRIPVLKTRVWNIAGQAVSICLTFAFVMIGFTIPRSSSLSEMIQNFGHLFGR